MHFDWYSNIPLLERKALEQKISFILTAAVRYLKKNTEK